MRTLRYILITFTVTLAAGCSASLVTRQGLVERMSTTNIYTGSRYLYMGSKNGYDYVTQNWEKDNFQNHPGTRLFKLRSGELEIGQSMPFTTDPKNWREIGILKKP